MKKQLLAIAVLGALSNAAFAADSAITLYGRLNVGFESFDNGAVKQFLVQDNTSFFGIKGEEKIDGGLTAVFQIENKVAMDNSSDSGNFASRNSYVGLKGDFGTVLMGRYDTPFKALKKNIDIIDGAGEQVEALIHQDQSSKVNFHTRQDNILHYATPNMSGFVAKVSFAPGEAKTATSDPQRWSFSGEYTEGPLNIGAAYEIRRDDVAATATTPNLKANAWRVTGSYVLDDTTIGLGYSKIERDSIAPAAKLSRPAWTIALQQKLGATTLKLAYADAKEDRSNAQNGASMWSLEGDYALSKRTSAYAIYSAINNEANGNYGFKNQNSANGSAPAAVGKDISVIGVGVRHNF